MALELFTLSVVTLRTLNYLTFIVVIRFRQFEGAQNNQKKNFDPFHSHFHLHLKLTLFLFLWLKSWYLLFSLIRIKMFFTWLTTLWHEVQTFKNFLQNLNYSLPVLNINIEIALRLIVHKTLFLDLKKTCFNANHEFLLVYSSCSKINSGLVETPTIRFFWKPFHQKLVWVWFDEVRLGNVRLGKGTLGWAVLFFEGRAQ